MKKYDKMELSSAKNCKDHTHSLKLLNRLCHGTFAVFSSKTHKYNSLYCLYLWAICYYSFEHKKKIHNKVSQTDLSRVDSGPKTQSVQSKNLKKLATFFKL